MAWLVLDLPKYHIWPNVDLFLSKPFSCIIALCRWNMDDLRPTLIKNVKYILPLFIQRENILVKCFGEQMRHMVFPYRQETPITLTFATNLERSVLSPIQYDDSRWPDVVRSQALIRHCTVLAWKDYSRWYSDVHLDVFFKVSPTVV